MAKTQTSCPRCRQPVVAEVEQLFDVGVDPQAKQRFLSGNSNRVRCRNCGYDGVLPTPLVYHDPEKELLLTYFPPELGLPVNEQEKLIGPMVTRIMNNLPPQKRKAYLFRPQNMFTLQTMLEKVLEADGITKEMLEAQQRKLNLLQRLASTPPEQRAEVIQQEEALIDEAFFNLLNRLIEVSMAQGDQQSAQVLGILMQDLLEHTEIGKVIKEQALEEQQALKSLQEAGKRGLTREVFLDLVLNAPTETRLNALASMARSAMDYNFFQLLTEKIDHTSAEEEKQNLVQLREKLLKITAEIDKAVQKQFSEARALLEKILAQPDINKALEENAAGLSEAFVEVLNTELQLARQKADLERINKLQAIANAIQEASAPPPELEVLNQLVTAETEEARMAVLTENAAMITPQFIEVFNTVLAQSEQQPEELRARLEESYRTVLRFNMSQNLAK
jgi:hypothetical protein